MAKITINGVSLDPQTRADSLDELIYESDYLLVQSAGPLNKPQRAQLMAAGAEPLEYVPEDTYICRATTRDLAPLRALPFVSWLNLYLEGFKIAPELRQSAPRSQLVDIVLHRDVDAEAVRAQLAAAAGFEPESIAPSAGKWRVHVPLERLAALSAIDAVRHIEPVYERKLFNHVALGANVVHKHVALQGEGEVVAVCDTGFDLGSLKNVHPAFKNRVLKLYALGRATATDPDGHGTHVCGSLLGDGASSTLGSMRGAAPKAKLVVQSVLDARGGLSGLPDDLGQIFETPYSDDGVRVHSNSWGEPSSGAYTTSAHELDDYVWNHRDLVIVFAAGNAGQVDDQGSVGSPGSAKNCITVGACEAERPELVAACCELRTRGEAWQRVSALASGARLATFSSRGPTRDGRIKPDLVAPGTAMLSTRSRAKGTSVGPAASSDPLYLVEGGTSMAAPLVAGCAAIVRQYFRQGSAVPPSAALVKASLINAATHLTSQQQPSECGALPNLAAGFGCVNLCAAVEASTEGSLFKFWDEGDPLETGDEHTFKITLSEGASAFKATLVWTDPPGESLQNDLDLIATTAQGSEWHGNMRAGASAFDRCNNVEQISLTRVAAGDITLTVKAHRVALHAQSFALVVRAKP